MMRKVVISVSPLVRRRIAAGEAGDSNGRAAIYIAIYLKARTQAPTRGRRLRGVQTMRM